MHKDARFQDIPETPNFGREAKEAVEYEGLPPLAPKKSITGTIVFKNVKSVIIRVAEGDAIAFLFDTQDEMYANVFIRVGKIACAGAAATCLAQFEEANTIIDLKGGAISPGLIFFGSPLGLEEIEAESSTAVTSTTSLQMASLVLSVAIHLSFVRSTVSNSPQEMPSEFALFTPMIISAYRTLQ